MFKGLTIAFKILNGLYIRTYLTAAIYKTPQENFVLINIDSKDLILKPMHCINT